MKGGRIALPSEYFTGKNSGNYSEENGNNYTQGGQQNCGDSYGPDLLVQNGGRKRRSARKSSARKSSARKRSARTRSARKSSARTRSARKRMSRK
jgi:hypothetical protein